MVLLALAVGGALAQAASTNALARLAEDPGTNRAAAQLSFGLHRVPWLTYRLFEAPLWRCLATLIYILLAFLVSKAVDYIVGVRLKKWAERTATRWDDIVIGLLHGPTKVVAFVILLHIGLNVFPWPTWLVGYVSKGLLLVVAGSLTYVALKLADASLEFWRQRAMARGGDKLLDEQLLPVMRIGLRVFVLTVAGLLTAHNLGLNITSLIASLSIGGLALGLAAQDTLANLFGAVAVFVDRPFKVGDTIRLDSVEGKVESIGVRSTRVRNAEGSLVTIPNKTVGNAAIVNITRRPTIRTEINLGLTYDLSVDKLRHALAIVEEVFRGHPRTQEAVISFNKFTDSALNIMVVHKWRGKDGAGDYKQYVADLQEMNLQLKERFDREGLEFAFPTETHYVKQVPAGQ